MSEKGRGFKTLSLTNEDHLLVEKVAKKIRSTKAATVSLGVLLLDELTTALTPAKIEELISGKKSDYEPTEITLKIETKPGVQVHMEKVD